MIYICLIVLTFINCTYSMSFEFAATQSPNRLSYFGGNTIKTTCDPTKKCAIDISDRSTCERLGCCFLNNNCYAKKYFIINKEPSAKVPKFTIPLDNGKAIQKNRADALKYCQDNYPNGQLPVFTATDNWLTLAGRTEMLKDAFAGITSIGNSDEFYLYADYDLSTKDVSSVDGEFLCKREDIETTRWYPSPTFTSLTIFKSFKIENNSPNPSAGLYILCQHD